MSDLKRMTVSELDALIAKAQSVREETREKRRLEIKSEFEKRLKEEGFSAIEVLGAKLKPKPQPLPAKYADPADPSHTWSGKGRVPGWLQAQLDDGASLTKFLINKKELT